MKHCRADAMVQICSFQMSDKQSVQNAIKKIDSHNIDYALFMMLQYNLVQYS